jgi:threonine synthase
LSSDFFDAIENLSNEEIAFEAIKQFIGDEIPAPVLKEIIADTLCFDFRLSWKKAFIPLNYSMGPQWLSRT